MLTPPPFGQRLKTRDHIVHIVHKCPRMARARMAHGTGQQAIDPCGHCPHCPPLKYYIVRFCKVGGRWPRGHLLFA